MLTVEAFRTPKELGALAGTWRELQARIPCDNVFATWEFLSVWLQAFRPHESPLFLLVRDGGEPVGLAPFLVNERRRRLVLPARSVNVRTGLLVAPQRTDVLRAIFEYLLARSAVWHMCFAQLDATCVLGRSLAELVAQHRLICVSRPGDPAPIVQLDGDWDTFLQNRTRHFRSELRRKQKHLERAGRVEYRYIAGPAGCKQAYQDVLSIEQRSWKARQHSAMTSTAEKRRFYDALTAVCAPNGLLRMHVLYLDGRPIAHVYGLVYKNRFNALTTAYDESAAGLSPGAVLMAEALRSAFADRLSEFDLLGEPYRWKNELTTVHRPHLTVELDTQSVRSRMHCLIECTCKPWIRTHAPWVLHLRRRLTGRPPCCQKDPAPGPQRSLEPRPTESPSRPA